MHATAERRTGGKADSGEKKAAREEKPVTWDEIEEIALGELGMMPDDFYALTPRQFDNKLSGFRNAQQASFRDEWERTRFLAYFVCKPYFSKGKQNMGITAFYPFDWDKKEEADGADFVLDPEKAKAVLAKAQEFWKRVDEGKREFVEFKG